MDNIKQEINQNREEYKNNLFLLFIALKKQYYQNLESIILFKLVKYCYDAYFWINLEGIIQNNSSLVTSLFQQLYSIPYIFKLRLILDYNKIGSDENCTEEFFKLIQAFPTSLKSLECLLFANEILDSPFISQLSKTNALSKTPSSLTSFDLKLYSNYSSKIPQNLEYFLQAIADIYPNLEYLSLDLQQNQISENSQSVQYLSKGLKSLQNLNSLKELKIYLNSNGLGKDHNDIKLIIDSIIPTHPGLSNLFLSLKNNKLSENAKNGEIILEAVKSISPKLKELSLSYGMDDFTEELDQQIYNAGRLVSNSYTISY